MTCDVDPLTQLAERPDDRSLRLVYADWLLERGDDRGEVISLCARGALSPVERKRVMQLSSMRSAQWLGPLVHLADLERTHFVDGFLDQLACNPGLPAALYRRLRGEPGLASVTSFAVAPAKKAVRLHEFLSHSVMNRVQRLELGAADWLELRELVPLKYPQMVVSSCGTFHDELDALARAKLLNEGALLGLATTEFVNPMAADDICAAMLSQRRALEPFEELRLIVRYGVLEGIAAWLLAANRFITSSRLTRWAAESGDTVLSCTREDGGRFEHLQVEIGPRSFAQGGLATVASVLVLLSPARLESMTVSLPMGQQFRNHERQALVAAARRSKTLKRLTLGHEVVLVLDEDSFERRFAIDTKERS